VGCRWKSTFKVKIILTKDHNPFYILNLCWSYTHNIFKFNPNKHASRGHHVIAEMENRKNFGQRAFTTCMSIYTTVSLQAKYKILLFTKWQLSLLTITSHSIPPQWPGLAYFTMYYYSSFFSFFFSFSTMEIYLTKPKCKDQKKLTKKVKKDRVRPAAIIILKKLQKQHSQL